GRADTTHEACRSGRAVQPNWTPGPGGIGRSTRGDRITWGIALARGDNGNAERRRPGAGEEHGAALAVGSRRPGRSRDTRVGNSSHAEERREEVRDESIPKSRSWHPFDEHLV